MVMCATCVGLFLKVLITDFCFNAIYTNEHVFTTAPDREIEWPLPARGML